METVRNNLIKYLETKNLQILKGKRPNEILILTMNINCWIQVKYWSSIDIKNNQRFKLFLCHKNGKIVKFINILRTNIDSVKLLKLNKIEIRDIKEEIKIYELTYLEKLLLLIFDKIKCIYFKKVYKLIIEKKLLNTITNTSVIIKNKRIYKKYIFPQILGLKNKYNDLLCVLPIIELQNIIINYLIYPQKI